MCCRRNSDRGSCSFVPGRPVRQGVDRALHATARWSARGAFLAFLDDDDEWVDRDHLAIAVSALQASGADYYFANMRGVRGEVVAIPSYLPGAARLTDGPIVGKSIPVHHVSLPAFAAAMKHHFIHPNMMVIRRTLRERTGLFHEKIRCAEDVDWALRLGDGANGILYRDGCVAQIRLPVEGSSSLWESELNHLLDDITAAQHVRARASTPAIRACARAKEAWA